MTTANDSLSHLDIKYNCLIGSTPDVIGELELDGTISFISQQVYDMLGYHPDEMIGTKIIKITHPDDVPTITKNIKKVIKSKKVVVPKLRLKHKQGNYILVFIMGKLMKLTDKPRLISVIRDITKIDETEKKLEESQSIFEQLNDVFLKFIEDPIINLQLLVNTAGLLLNADCALFNIIKRVDGKNVLESLVTYNEPPNFTRESDPKGHICTDIIKDNPDDVVIIRNIDKTDYIKTDENVRKYNLKQYVSYVVKFNNKPTATFCVVYTDNREMSNNDISILHILSKSASTELARWISQSELQESEEKYRSLVEGLDEALYRMSLPDGNYTYFSPAAKEVFGYSSKDFLDNPMFIKKIMHPDFRDYFNEKWADLLKGNVPRTYEYKIIDPDNKERWIKQSNKIIFDSDGNFSAIESLCRNITERKEVKQKIRESEDKYKNLFVQSPFAIVLINLDGRIEDCNAQAENLFGYTKEEIVGKNFRELNIFSHDDLPKLARSFEKFIKTGVPEPSEFQTYKKDGTSIWIRSYPIVVKIAGSSYALATLYDLTRSKNFEEQIHYQAKLIENVSDAIISTDIDFNIISWNNAAKNMYGWSAKEVIGKNIYDTIRVEYPHDDRETVLETFLRKGIWRGEIIQSKKDNSKIPVYSSVNLLKDFRGNPIGAVAINRDISELKKTGDKLRESEQKFRNITEQNLMGIGILQDNTLKYINKAMADIYGYSVEEMLNWKPSEFLKIFAPDTLEIAREQVLKKQAGDPTQLNHYIVHGVKKTGELIWVDNVSRSITYEGRPADLVSQIDITKKLEAEQKLKESELKFRKAVENSPDYILFINHKGIIIDVNRLEKGFKKKLVIGQSVFNERFYEKKSQCESARKAINDSLIYGKTTSYEYSQIAPDGLISFYETRVSPFEHDKENKIISLQLATRDITDRRKIEQNLKESEEKYRYFFNNAQIGLFWSRISDGKFLECNDTFANLVGYDTQEECLADYVSLEHYVNLKDRDEMLEKIKLNGDIKNYEIQVTKRDDTPFWVSISARINLKEDRIEGAATDITEQKNIELKLKESEVRYKDLFENSPISLWEEDFSLVKDYIDNLKNSGIKDLHEFFKKNPEELKKCASMVKIVNVNKRTLELYQVDNIESLLVDRSEIFTDESLVVFMEEIIAFAEGKTRFESEAITKTLKGEKFHHLSVVEIANGFQKDWSKVLISIIDITKRKEAEEERNRFFNLALHILLIAKFDGTILRTNPGWKEILGYDESDLLGINFKDLIHPDDQEKTILEMEGLSKGCVTKHFENRYKRKDGSYRTLAWSAVPHLDRKTVYAIAYDVSEQKRIESEIIESEKKFKDILEAVPIGIIISNLKGELFEVNSSAIKMFGFDSKEEFQKSPAESYYGDPADRLQFVRLLENGPVREFEIKFKHKNGKLFWGALTSIAKTVNDDVLIFNAIQDISERKIDEEIIADLAKFPAENPNPVLRVSKSERILYINPVGKNIFQTKIGNKIPPALEKDIRIAIKANKNLNSEIQLYNHIYSIFIVPIEGKEYTNVYAMDITECTIKEQNLKDSQKKFKLLNEELEMILDNLPGLVFFKDDKNNYIKVNKYIADAHEKTKSELEGKSLFDLYPKEEAQKYFDDDLEVIKSKKPKIECIEPWDVAQGRRWINSSKIPLFDENNKGIGIIGFSKDVTAQVNSELRLRESEKKYRSLVETAEMGLIEFDFIENRVSYINPKLLEITGYTKDEVFDEKAVIEIIHSEDLENLIKPSEGLHVEFRIYTKDQKLRWLSGIRSNQYDKEGKIIKTILWLWDATERREIEEIKSDLLTRFSHEFKTPLISIMGFTELLMSTCEDKMDKKALSFLNNIKNGSERLNTLVNTFIESSHLDKDFSKLELGRVNLLTLIEKALREVKGVAILRNHLIDISVDEKLMVEIDKDRIYTVLTNLILNAIKYTPIGGTILIRSKIEQDFIVTSISDNGIGITSSEKEKLFERFGKIERYGHGWDIITDGIGMGLYISKKIITEHGGKIWVESQGRNRGSTFNFTIPIRKN